MKSVVGNAPSRAVGILMLVAVACVCATVDESFADERGKRSWYLAGHASLAFAQKAGFDYPQTLGTGTRVDILGGVTFNTGWGGGLAAGRSWNDFRVEGEALWRRAGLKDVEITHHKGNPVASALEDRLERSLDVSGNMDIWAGMLNIHYDIPTGKALRPYVGAGLGSVHAFMHKTAILTGDLGDGENISFATDDKDEDRWGFCYQIQAGIGFDLTDYLSVQVGYRFIHLPSLKFHLFEDIVEKPSIISTKPFHSVDLGLRWNF